MILYPKYATPVKCQTGWTGRNCDACAPNFGPPNQCDISLTGWAGENCTDCATNFRPPGQCNMCITGWGGRDCGQCAGGWTGETCTECAVNYGPPGQCNSCLRGWSGFNCDVCGLGFNSTRNCTECIKNGKWAGTEGVEMVFYLTFDGPDCDNLVSGKSKNDPSKIISIQC